MTYKAFNFISILFLLLPFLADAQDEVPYHESFTVRDGLPSNTIYDIMQDSKGYIWAGTSNGLVRFNGKEFKEYSSPESVDSEYSYLHELKDGSIWCINFGNQVLKISGDSLIIVDVFEPYMDDKKYFVLHEWKDSILYLENQDRILSYDPFNHILEDIKKPDSLLIQNFCRDENHIYYTSLSHQKRSSYLNTYSIQNKTTSSRKLLAGRIFESNGFSYFFKMTKKGHYPGYVFPFDSLKNNNLNHDNSIFKIEDVVNQRINSITHLGDNNIWISTKKGCINPYSKKHIFPNHEITKIIQDNEKNYWLSTYNNGIFFIPNLELKYIPAITTGVNKLDGIHESQIMIGGTDGYAYTYDIHKKKIIHSLFINEINTKKLILTKQNKLLIHEPFTYLMNLDHESALRPTAKKMSLNIKNHNLFDQHLLLQLKNNIVLLFHQDTYLGINGIPFIPLSKNWELTGNCNNSPDAHNYCYHKLRDESNNVENIHYEAAEKRIWIAFTKKTSTEQNQLFSDFKQKNNTELKLNCFADHMDKGLIAANRNSGLIFIIKNNIISETNHRIYNEFGSIRKIITADSLIISLAKKGIIISDKNGNPIHTLDRTDGLEGGIIKDIRYQSGFLWIGTSRGLYKIHISKFRDNLIPPKTYIKNILVNHKKITAPLIKNTFSNNADIEIHYETLCYKGAHSFYYKYRLRQDEHWKILSANSSPIRFPNLSSGKYQFQIMAINEEGIEGNITHMEFRVNPPFWLRWWFILAMIILIGLILFIYDKRNSERIEKENQFNQEIRSNKLSALQSRMNPHFIFNSLNSIQDFIIKLDKEGANEYLGIFSDLLRVYLSHSEKDSIELHEEIESLRLYLKLEELRFGDIFVDFSIAQELRHMDILIPPLFVQPYVENAFRHGLLHKKSDKQLMIAFKLENNQLLIHIRDNGVGRAKVREIQHKTLAKGLSYSTKANQIRLELLNHNRTKKIKVNTIDLYDQNIPKGTLIEIIIPLLDI